MAMTGLPPFVEVLRAVHYRLCCLIAVVADVLVLCLLVSVALLAALLVVLLAGTGRAWAWARVWHRL